MITFSDTISFKISAKAKDELIQCEYGSYEDHIGTEQCGWCEGSGLAHGPEERDCPKCMGKRTVAKREPPYNETGRLHAVEILERDKRKTRISFNSSEELREVFEAMSSGTFGLYCLKTLRRLYREMSPYVSEEVKKRYPYGTLGY